jgi:hypothetical protein
MPLTILFISISAALVVPQFAHAMIPFFGPIIPQGAQTCALGWGALITVINNIIELALTLAIVFLAPLMIAYAGFRLVSSQGNPSEINKAKGMITNLVMGIVIALAAWLIVDAIMAVLYHPDSSTGWTETWSSLIMSNGVPCISQTGISETGEPQPSASVDVVVPTVNNEQAIRQQLAQAGVTINHNPCPTGSSGSGCTNVAGMRPATVAQIIAIKEACGDSCNVQVTGGTEPGHAAGLYSHSTGYKVDLALNATLNAYLESLTSAGIRTGDNPGPAYTDRCIQNGNQYVKESNHWDITVYSTCIPLK